MYDKKTDTDTLLQRLLKTNSIGRFFARHDDDVGRFPSFSEYIGNLCAQKGVSAESIIKKSEIERTYGHKFFNGTRIPSRDKVLQLAFGFEMNYEEAKMLLSVARKSPLHPKIKRDAAIIFALKKGFGIAETQALLLELGSSVLGGEKSNE